MDVDHSNIKIWFTKLKSIQNAEKYFILKYSPLTGFWLLRFVLKVRLVSAIITVGACYHHSAIITVGTLLISYNILKKRTVFGSRMLQCATCNVNWICFHMVRDNRVQRDNIGWEPLVEIILVVFPSQRKKIHIRHLIRDQKMLVSATIPKQPTAVCWLNFFLFCLSSSCEARSFYSGM